MFVMLVHLPQIMEGFIKLDTGEFIRALVDG